MINHLDSPLNPRSALTNQLTPLRVHFWPLASEAEMGSYDGIAPRLRRWRR
jgi:hypothetical protein